MNFNTDDPLGELSDGSNDSFFDEPKVQAKRSSLTKTPEKKSINDLFNLSTDQSASETKRKTTDDWLGLDPAKEETPVPEKRNNPKPVKKSISFEDDDDILGNLGLGKSRPQSRTETQEEMKPKKDPLEGILKPIGKSENKIDNFTDILKENRRNRTPDTPPKSPQTPLKTEFQISEASREGRRNRNRSVLDDPLGLFGVDKSGAESNASRMDITPPASTPERPKPLQSKSAPNIADTSLPNWLAGGAAGATRLSKSESTLQTEPKPDEAAQVVQAASIEPTPQNDTLNAILTQQKLAQSQTEYQNTSMALQQQESQLIMALHLKKYDEVLSQMQVKQHEVLSKQEHHFNTLLERQFARQQAMESNLRLQQERINNHIQLLLAQPGVDRLPTDTADENKDFMKSAKDESIKLYENVVSSLKDRQKEEVFLLEESYKKQITLLEQSLESVEFRLKSDIDKLNKMFEDKLETMQQQHEEEVTKFKSKTQEIEAMHSEEIDRIRNNHARVIEDIKSEHALVIENIKSAKQSETALFSDSNTYLRKLDSNIEVLYTNSKALQEIRHDMESSHGAIQKMKEESLRSKEQDIELMRTALEKCRQSAEDERTQLMGLVRTLETKLAEQNQSSREERWALQQASATLAARSAALDREFEFNRTANEREREQLENLRVSILAEQEKMMLQITEERLAVSAEKSRLETSSKLNVNFDSQRAKAEADSIVKVAKEAIEMADVERHNLQMQHLEVEKLKRSLIDKERKLSVRENELENAMRNAEMKISDSENALSKSKEMENRCNDRLRRLQSQLVILSEKEKKLAQEKLFLSKQRLMGSYNAMASRQPNKKCGLCSNDSQIEEVDFKPELLQYLPILEDNNNDVIRFRLAAMDADDNRSIFNIEENIPLPRNFD